MINASSKHLESVFHQLLKSVLGRRQAPHRVWFLGVIGAHIEHSLCKLEGTTSCMIAKKKVLCGACVQVCVCVFVCAHMHMHKRAEREEIME